MDALHEWRLDESEPEDEVDLPIKRKREGDWIPRKKKNLSYSEMIEIRFAEMQDLIEEQECTLTLQRLQLQEMAERIRELEQNIPAPPTSPDTVLQEERESLPAPSYRSRRNLFS